MKAITHHLQKIVSGYAGRLESIREGDFSSKPIPEKWSKKEILGHLIDSAQNNIRRFVVAQYEESPVIVYDQDKWVSIAGYQQYPSKDLVDLWRLLNLHICHILSNTSAEAARRICDIHGTEAQTIEWLAADYCDHLLHHLHQILELDPIAYP